MLLNKGNNTIKIREKKSKIQGYNYTYVITEHKRSYTCQSTPKLIKVLSKLEGKGFKEV